MIIFRQECKITLVRGKECFRDKSFNNPTSKEKKF